MALAHETRRLTGLTTTQQGTVGLLDAGVEKEEERREVSLCGEEGARLGLYDLIGETGPVTLFGLAQDAGIPMSLAQRWLASQVQSGHVVRDVATGEYRTWCILPTP
jgi:hypothetical protein